MSAAYDLAVAEVARKGGLEPRLVAAELDAVLEPLEEAGRSQDELDAACVRFTATYMRTLDNLAPPGSLMRWYHDIRAEAAWRERTEP